MSAINGRHGGLKYSYVSAGDGDEPMIVGLTGFAMGLQSSWDYLNFSKTSQLLPYGRSAGYQVLLIEPPERTWTRTLNPFRLFRLSEEEIWDRVYQVSGLVESLGNPARRTIAGFSDGGVAVQYLLARWPELFSDVVLYSTTPARTLEHLAKPVQGKRIQVLSHDKEWFVWDSHIERLVGTYSADGTNEVSSRTVNSRYACTMCPLRHHYWEAAENAVLFPPVHSALQGVS